MSNSKLISHSFFHKRLLRFLIFLGIIHQQVVFKLRSEYKILIRSLGYPHMNISNLTIIFNYKL